MATATNAFISFDNICASWMLQHGKPDHVYWKIAKLCGMAVQKLSLMSMPMVNHTILTKNDNETWFTLPPGYTDYVSVGIQCGEVWRPIGVSNQLMPMPNNAGGGQYGTAFSPSYNTQGGWTNWINPTLATVGASFNGADFNFQDYLTQDSQASGSGGCGCLTPGGSGAGNYYPYGWAGYYNDYGESTGRMYGAGDGYRPDTVVVNAQKGIIMCPLAFPGNHLYLVWVGVGTVDTMTQIPIQAQLAIEAYISWKYVANKRNGAASAEARVLENEFNNQHTLMLRSFNTLSVTDIHRIIMKFYGQTQRIG